MEVDPREIKSFVKAECQDFSYRELECIVNKAILSGPLTKISNAKHWIYDEKTNKYKISECGGEFSSHLDYSSSLVNIPKLDILDLINIARKTSPSNSEHLIMNNINFESGVFKDPGDTSETINGNANIEVQNRLFNYIVMFLVVLALVFVFVYVEFMI